MIDVKQAVSFTGLGPLSGWRTLVALIILGAVVGRSPAQWGHVPPLADTQLADGETVQPIVMLGTDEQHLAFARQFAGRLIWTGYRGIRLTTGAVITGRFCSGVRFNSECVLTAGHCRLYSAGTYQHLEDRVGTGLDYPNAPGDVRVVNSVIVYPGFTDTIFPPTQPDLAVYRLARQLPGIDAVVGSIEVGETLSIAGYGRASYLYGTTWSDGKARACRAPVGADNLYGPAPMYLEAFLSGLSTDPLAGRGQPGDSGGPGFNAVGDLVGVTSYGTNGTGTGSTGQTRLNTPPVMAWLAAHTQLIVASAPVSLIRSCPGDDGVVTLSVAANGVAPTYQWRWRVKPAEGVSIEDGWNPIVEGVNIDLRTGEHAFAAVVGQGGSLMLIPSSLRFETREVDVFVTSSIGSIATLPTTWHESCAADFNCDGGVDGGDVVAFFGDWQGGESRADTNGDGGVDGEDVASFFEWWQRGGC
jgi:hypothetical protein